MKYIYALFLKFLKKENTSVTKRAYYALVVNIILWFVIGSTIAWLFGTLCRMSNELLVSCAITTGACSSLIIGYGYGVVWLLRHAE